MANHAGPRRCECPPGTKLWRSPAFETQESMKQKLLETVQVTALFHTFLPLKIFFGLTKTETAPPKQGYKGGRAPQPSAWGTLAKLRHGPAWSVIYICTYVGMHSDVHKQTKSKKFFVPIDYGKKYLFSRTTTKTIWYISICTMVIIIHTIIL